MSSNIRLLLTFYFPGYGPIALAHSWPGRARREDLPPPPPTPKSASLSVSVFDNINIGIQADHLQRGESNVPEGGVDEIVSFKKYFGRKGAVVGSLHLHT